MATITLKYDARNASVKKALELLFTLGVTEEKSDYPYDRKFADKLIESRKSKGVKIKDADLWKWYIRVKH